METSGAPPAKVGSLNRKQALGRSSNGYRSCSEADLHQV
jgi:hypothetical protein